jgi:ubiquinone/menaquinone biosynthesis C-methylase UbiE
VGCGYNIADGFINLDYQWRPGIDLCWDMRVALPFEDGSLDGIFCEHALEHVTADEGLAVLREFRRVLRPNGVARVVVPDAAIYLQAYCRYQRGQTFEIPLAPSPLPEGVTPLMATGRVFLDHGHRCAYDKETLENQMRRAGFANVQHKAYGVGLDPVLLIDTPRRAVESLYMDAQPSVADVG